MAMRLVHTEQPAEARGRLACRSNERLVASGAWSVPFSGEAYRTFASIAGGRRIGEQARRSRAVKGWKAGTRRATGVTRQDRLDNSDSVPSAR